MSSTSTGTRRSRTVPRLVAAALAAVLALTGCAGGNEIQSNDEDSRFVSGDGSAGTFAEGERADAPDVEGTTLDGDRISLSDYEGGIVVLNVWASWCGPCRTEQPVLDEVHAEYVDLGVDFLGVNIKDNETAARSYLKDKGVVYPSLYDQPGEVPQAFRDTVPPRAIPSTLVIDPEGRIAARVIGPTTYNQLTGLLDPLVVESGFGDPEERPRVAEQEAEDTASWEDDEGGSETGDEPSDDASPESGD